MGVMSGPLKIRSVLRWEPVVAAAAGALVIGVGAWVTPKAIEAMAPDPPPLGEVTVEGATPDERRVIVEGLRTILESSYAYVCSRNAGPGAPASITLWQTDDQHRGHMDAGEALVLTHSHLLETIAAVIVEDAGAEDAVDSDDLCGPDAAQRLRRYGTVSPRVIGTGVRSLSIAPRREAGGTLELTLGLTWTPTEVEAQEESGPPRTTLRVRLRLVEGMGR